MRIEIMHAARQLPAWLIFDVSQKMRLVAFLLFGFLAGLPVIATSAYDVTASDRKFLAEVLAAVARKDAMWIASHSLIPIAVGSGRDRRVLATKEEVAAVIARTLTDQFCVRFNTEAEKAPFKNWQGVMIGDGLLWFGEYRHSEGESWRYAILAFGGFAFQAAERANKAPEPTPGSVTPRASE